MKLLTLEGISRYAARLVDTGEFKRSSKGVQREFKGCSRTLRDASRLGVNH